MTTTLTIPTETPDTPTCPLSKEEGCALTGGDCPDDQSVIDTCYRC